MKQKLTCIVLTLMATTLWADAPAPEGPTPADVDYALGYLLGKNLASTGVQVDLDRVAAAMKEAFAHKPPRFDDAHAQQIVQAAIQAAQEKTNAVLKVKEADYLSVHAKGKGVITTATGLQYEVVNLGKGPKPAATDTVKVNYVGTLTDGTEFDNSVKRGEPAVFPLSGVIPAWTEGLQLMPVGSKFRFTVPSELAYGAQGAAGVIPPFATLIFEVDLLSIEPPAPAQKD